MRIMAILVSVWVWLGPAIAEDRGEIEAVIAGQLEAFNDRDIAQAWTYASPMIQRMFGTPANFGQMVRQGYPMVWDNSAPEFRALEDTGQALVQEVHIRDPAGAGWLLRYAMVATDRGWKINGVTVVPAPELSA